MWKITLSDLVLTAEDKAAVQDALDSNWLTMGSRTTAFEQAFAEALDPADPPHALAVGSGTAALHMAMLALGVGPGDEVIVPGLTFVATANAVLYTGATVVVADVTSADDPTLSIADVERKLTDRTAAVIAVHYGGHPGHILELRRLCDQAGVHVVEDAAHSPVADSPPDGSGHIHPLGAIGTVGCMSFFSNKNMTTAEGGMVVTRDPEVAEQLRLLRSHGMTALTLERHRGHAHGYDCVALGWNYRIDEIRAALGLSQLSRLDANNRRRTELFARYHRLLADVPGLELPFHSRLDEDLTQADQGRRLSPHIMVTVLPQGCDRAAVQGALKDAGIQTSVHYPPLHRFTLHADHPRVRAEGLEVIENLSPRLLTLPLYATMTDEDVATVADALRAALAQSFERG